VKITSDRIVGVALPVEESGRVLAEMTVSYSADDGDVPLLAVLYHPDQGMAGAWLTAEGLDWNLLMRAIAVVVYWEKKELWSVDGREVEL